MRLEHHLVGGYVRYLSPHIIIIIIPFTHSLTAVPFVRGHRSVFPRTPRNTGVYTRHPTFVTATSGVLTRLPA